MNEGVIEGELNVNRENGAKDGRTKKSCVEVHKYMGT